MLGIELLDIELTMRGQLGGRLCQEGAASERQLTGPRTLSPFTADQQTMPRRTIYSTAHYPQGARPEGPPCPDCDAPSEVLREQSGHDARHGDFDMQDCRCGDCGRRFYY